MAEDEGPGSQRLCIILRDGVALRLLSTLFNEGVTGAVTDGQLLERFATRRGEAVRGRLRRARRAARAGRAAPVPVGPA